MKYILTLILLLVPATVFAGDHPFEQLLKGLLEDKAVATHVDRADPVAPFFAEKYLRGDAWSAWAIEHNRSATEYSRENARSGREVRVNIGSPYYPPYPGQHGPQTYQSYSYYLDGGAPPVILYNPYVQPK